MVIFGALGLQFVEARANIRCVGHVTGRCYEMKAGDRAWVDKRDWEKMRLYQTQEGTAVLREAQWA